MSTAEFQCPVCFGYLNLDDNIYWCEACDYTRKARGKKRKIRKLSSEISLQETSCSE